MTLLTKYDPSLHLGLKYPQILEALPKPYYLTYPNKKETLLFGDGHRNYSPKFLQTSNISFLYVVFFLPFLTRLICMVSKQPPERADP